MANLYEGPLPMDTSITPLTMPFDILAKGQLGSQQRYDDVSNQAVLTEDEILATPTRPNAKEDIEFVKGLYSNFQTKFKDFISDSHGEFSTTDLRSLKTIAQNTLLPSRQALGAISTNAKLWEERQKLKAQLSAEGRELDFDDSLDNAPSVMPDGTPVIHSIGIERRGDWYQAMEALLEKVGKNHVIQDAIAETGMSTEAFIKGHYNEIMTREAIRLPSGKVISGSDINAVVKSNVDEYIETDANGQQQFRWYVKQFKDSNKGAYEQQSKSSEALQQDAESFAKDKILKSLQDVALKFKDRTVVEKDMLQANPAYQAPVDPNSSSSKKSSKEQDDIIDKFGVDISVSAVGSQYKTFEEFSSAVDQLESPYNPKSFMYSQDGKRVTWKELSSIPQLQGRILDVGPDDDSNRYGKYDGHQFQNKSSVTRGELQLLDDNEGRTGDKNRAVIKIDQKDFGEYKDFLKMEYANSPETLRRLLAEVDAHERNKLPLRTSAFGIYLLADGSSAIRTNAFMTSSATPGSPYEEQYKKASEFLEENQQTITEMLSKIDTLKQKHVGIKERFKQTLTDAGITLEDWRKMKQEEERTGTPSLYTKSKKQATKAETAYFDVLSEEFIITGDLAKTVSQTGNLKYNTFVKNIVQSAAQGGAQYLNQVGYGTINPYDKDAKAAWWKNALAEANLDPNTTIDGFTGVGLPGKMPIYKYFSMVVNLQAASSKGQGLIQSAEAAKNEVISQIDPRMARLIKSVEDQSKTWSYNNLAISLPMLGNSSENKHLYDALTGLVRSSMLGENRTLYKRVFSLEGDDSLPGDRSKQKAYNLSEALVESANIDGVNVNKMTNSERAKWFEQAKSKLTIENIRFDNQDGIVVDVGIGNSAFEVRGVKGLENIIFGNNSRIMSLFNQSVETLRDNDYSMGRIGDGTAANNTEFFVANTERRFNDGQVIPKGHYYIYIDGKRKSFKNPFELINWHIENKDQGNTDLMQAGTPLAMSPREFEFAYPGVNREEYAHRFSNMLAAQMNTLTLPPVAKASGYSEDQLEYRNHHERGADVYLTRLEVSSIVGYNGKNILQEGDRDDAGKVSLTKVETDNQLVTDSPGENIVVAKPLARALEDLKSLYNGQVVVTHSLRSVPEMINIYGNNYSQRKYSPHLQGLSVDLRYKNEEGAALDKFLRSNEGIAWMKKHSLRALVHTEGDNGIHIDLSINADIPNRPKVPWVYKNEETNTVIGL